MLSHLMGTLWEWARSRWSFISCHLASPALSPGLGSSKMCWQRGSLVWLRWWGEQAVCGVGRSGSAGGSIWVQHKQQSSSALLVPCSDPLWLQAREGCPAACCWPAGLGRHLWHGSEGERGQRLNEKHLEIVLNAPVSFLIGCKHGRCVNAGSHLCLTLMVLSGQISALGSCLLSQADAGERWVIWGNALLVVNQQGAEVRAEKCSECCCRKPGTVAQSHDTIAA